MATTKINLEKAESTPASVQTIDHSDRLQEMEAALRKFFERLDKPNEQFNPADAFDELLRYINNYDRILYSAISNIIYAHYSCDDAKGDPAGTLLSNLDALIRYSENESNIAAKKSALSKNQTAKSVDDARRVVLKIWDHVTLASQQYTMLKQSDAEYDEKFKKRIASYKEEMSKEMNTQMITMVGIFTALAFLIFGSISSLDGIFENINLPLFKVLSIGLIWGLCVSNMIFVFLYCVGKMTRLNFKANQSPMASIFQRYPIVWWTNLLLVSLLLLSTWGWFLQCSDIGQKIIDTANCSPWCVFGVGTIGIIILIVIGIVFFSKKTRLSESDE